MTLSKFLDFLFIMALPRFIEPMTMMAGASVVSGLLGSSSARRAARAQAAAIREQTAEGRRQFDLNWGAGATQRRVGEENINALNQYVGPDIYSDPSYQFRVSEGNRGLENYLSGRNRLGGSALRAVTDYNSNLAANEYANAYARDVNRLGTLAGYSVPGIQSGQNASTNYLNTINNATRNAMTQANTGTGQYSAWNNAIQGGLANYLSYNQNQQFMDAMNRGYGGYGGGGWQGQQAVNALPPVG